MLVVLVVGDEQPCFVEPRRPAEGLLRFFVAVETPRRAHAPEQRECGPGHPLALSGIDAVALDPALHRHVTDVLVSDAADEIVRMGFRDRREAFKVLMPKEPKLARRIGYTLTTSINTGLRGSGQHRSVRYWTYHHDADHYAIVLVNSDAVGDLDF